MQFRRAVVALVISAGAGAGSGCSDSPKGRTFFERTIAPILEEKCTGNTSGCHAVEAGDPSAVAAGNLDLTSFENLQKRRDLLAPFGAYPFPPFLIKAVAAKTLKFQYGSQFRDLDIQHVGEGIIDVGSDAFYTLQQWLENGATENGLKPASPPRAGDSACSTTIPGGFNAGTFTSNPTFGQFQSEVQPILKERGCGATNCHGAPQSDFYITCGDTPEQVAFNFSQTWAFVNAPADDSPLLRVPLAVAGGGRGHTGGDQFPTTSDPDFQRIRTWAERAGVRPFAGTDPGRQFFADHVQPLLIQRGCAFQACHSPQAGNDFKLRAGSIGFFSSVALEKNYELFRDEFMAVEMADARRGRAVAKSILEVDDRHDGIGGIAHRGGPVLETAATPARPNTQADPAACATPFNAATATAFCVIQEWLRIERQSLIAAGQVTPMDAGDPVSIVYVERTGGATAGRLEFDTFQGGADLRVVQTTFAAGNRLNPVGAAASTSLLGNCAGLTACRRARRPGAGRRRCPR